MTIRRFVARALPALAACALWPAAAMAQLDDALQLERLRLSPDGMASVEGGEVQPDMAWSAGAWTGWSQNPLVAYRMEDGARIASLVSNRVGGSVYGSVGFRGWGQLSFELPAVFFQDRQLGSVLPAESVPGLSVAGIGTLRLTPKAQLLEARDHGVDLAVSVALGIPLSSGSSFTGESFLAFSPGVAVSRSFGAWRFAGAAGFTLRRSTELLNAEVGPELEAQLGAGYQPPLSIGGRQLPLSAELAVFAGASLTHPFAQANETPVELRGLLTYDVSPHVQLVAGGGRGLNRGWGTPDWRAFGGVRVDGSLLSMFAPRQPVSAPAPIPAPAPAIIPAIAPEPAPAPAPHPVEAQAGPVQVAGDRIQFEGTVRFETGSAEISESSGALLGSLAAFLVAHPELEMVRVEGHTDDLGAPAKNKDLSLRRAQAVVAALVDRGVDRLRLTFEGFGAARPLSADHTPLARARNRRVELHVLSATSHASTASR